MSSPPPLPTRRPLLLTVLIALAALLTAGCDDTTTPGGDAGTDTLSPDGDITLTWTRTTLGDGAWYAFPAAACDSTGRLHVAYLDLRDNTLQYLTELDGVQSLETADASPEAGFFAAMAIDSADRIHVVHLSPQEGTLRLSTRAAGAWTTRVVDPAVGFAGGYCDIVVDPDDVIHISYLSYSAGLRSLMVATDDGDSWNRTVVHAGASLGDIEGTTALTLDASGALHIAYGGENVLRYATNASGDWVTIPVDQGPSGADYANAASIATDGAGRIHILYDLRIVDELRHAWTGPAGWNVGTIAADGDWWNDPALRADTAGAIHAARILPTEGAVQYGVFDGTGIPLETLATRTDDGAESLTAVRLALAPDGTVHLVYIATVGETEVLLEHLRGSPTPR